MSKLLVFSTFTIYDPSDGDSYQNSHYKHTYSLLHLFKKNKRRLLSIIDLLFRFLFTWLVFFFYIIILLWHMILLVLLSSKNLNFKFKTRRVAWEKGLDLEKEDNFEHSLLLLLCCIFIFCTVM